VPEWYFLPLYAVLRSVPNKLLGLFLILDFILCIIFLPFICNDFIIRSTIFRPIYGIIVWFLIFFCILLGWIGSLPVISPFLEIGQFLTIFYFLIVLVLFKAVIIFEKYLYQLYILATQEKSGIKRNKE
jgi:ubiquinol-cytochrome c reductase cytochrome b subunit